MSISLRVVKVFIASPGDVATTRDAVRRAISLVNRLVAKSNGVLFEPIGWEDIPASKGERAQEVINPYVDAADIFVGLLARRFGTPTGIAESGLQEEYQRAAERWRSESPRPEVKVYFRKLPPAELADPSEQLQQVLAFKKAIATTDLYHEFTDDDDLQHRIEDELAAWVHQRAPPKIAAETSELRGVGDIEVQRLANLLGGADAPPRDETAQRLLAAGLVRESGDAYSLANSTEGFVAVAKHLNVARYNKRLLESAYFSEMLRLHLRSVVQSRYHVELAGDDLNMIHQLSALSPRVADYVLSGDTSMYDNLFQHATSLAKQHYASGMSRQNLIHRVQLAFASDSIDAGLMDAVDGTAIAGQIVAIGIRAVFENGKSLYASSSIPTIRAKFDGPGRIEKGQMVAATSPAFFVHQGTILSQLELLDEAVTAFGDALKLELSVDDRAAALNNLGLTLQKLGRPDEARKCLSEAAQLKPEADEIKHNLALLEAAK